MTGPRSVEQTSETLKRYALKPRKRLGQHFLRDKSYLAAILTAADVEANDQVLEVGAGTGVLTRALLQREAEVIALELDDSLFELLTKELALSPNLRLWHGNALDFDPQLEMQGKYKLVGNIPYYVTAPLVRHFLEADRPPCLLVLTVQREVADRMVAGPGKLSLLGVSVQYYADAKIIAHVPAGAFYPPPKVDSAIVRLVPHVTHKLTDPALFFEVVRAGFSVRRKQLVNSLSQGLQIPRFAARDALDGARIEETRRAETLSVEEWERLAETWLKAQQEDS